MSINIDFYKNNADLVTEQYNSVPFENVHKNILNELPTSGCVLDVGAGSGRDSFALAERGLKVTAVEPASEMMERAKENFSHENITWVSDKMPTLEKIIETGQKYDFILLSAVWMHVDLKDRKEAFSNLQKLLKPNAKMAISLRHGGFSDERKALPVSKDEMIDLSDYFNMKSASILENDADMLNRSDVSWEIMIFQNTPKRKLRRKRRF